MLVSGKLYREKNKDPEDFFSNEDSSGAREEEILLKE
jgi:hypothetical protein